MPLSTIASNQIKQNTIVDANINSSANIATSKLGTGSIIQTVVHQEDGVTTFTASGTSEELMIASNAADSTSHVSLSITPVFASSKILLTANVFYEGNQVLHSYLWGFHRDSTKLAAPSAGSRRTGISMPFAGYYDNDNASTPDGVNLIYYDSPNTTSAITYSASWNNSNSGAVLYLNHTVNTTDNSSYERGISFIMAQEIKV